MKIKSLIIVFFIASIISCSKSDKATENFRRGMYEGANKIQELNSESPTIPQGQEPPTYDQYERERQEVLSGDKSDQPKE